jgi:SPW repeat-containing protein
MRMTAAAKWQDWASFALGLWLAVSPWLADYSQHEAATANAAFLGLALALACHFEVSSGELSAEWLNLVAGLWLMAAPFVLGFGSSLVATANSIAVGTFIVVLAASAMSLDKEIGRWWQKRIAGH